MEMDFQKTKYLTISAVLLALSACSGSVVAPNRQLPLPPPPPAQGGPAPTLANPAAPGPSGRARPGRSGSGGQTAAQPAAQIPDPAPIYLTLNPEITDSDIIGLIFGTKAADQSVVSIGVKRIEINFDTRHMSLNEKESINYAKARVSFRSDSKNGVLSRDFATSEKDANDVSALLSVKRLGEHDLLSGALFDISNSEVKLEVSAKRLKVNTAEEMAQNPWYGDFYIVSGGKRNLIGSFKGVQGTLN